MKLRIWLSIILIFIKLPGNLTGSSCPHRQHVVFEDSKLHGRLETIHKHMIHGTNKELCRIICVRMFECNSYSINSAKQICEVYAVAKDDQGVAFINIQDWGYYTKKVIKDEHDVSNYLGFSNH